MTRTIEFFKHNAIALAALFIALGGTSYAAVAIPRNSVGARQLRKGAVTSQKIHTGAITPGKLSSKAFGGRILDLVEVDPNGSIVLSDPKGASTTMWTQGTSGIIVLPHAVPKGCVPSAGAVSPVPATSAEVPAVSAGFDNSTEVQLLFNGQFPMTVAILCER